MNHLASKSAAALFLFAFVAGCAADPAPVASEADDVTSGTALSLRRASLEGASNVLLTGTEAGTIFATYKQGAAIVVARSDDGGASFTTLSKVEREKLKSAKLVAAPSDPNVLYLTHEQGGSWGYGPDEDDTTIFLRSADGGKTWEDRTDKLLSAFNEMDINPTNPNHLVTASCAGLLKSTDGGSSWRVAPGTEKLGQSGGCNNGYLARGVNDRKTMYLTFDIGEGGGSVTYRTTDDAVTWTPAKLETAEGWIAGAHSIVVDPKDAKHVFTNGNSSFYSSADGAETLHRHGIGLDTWPTDVAVDAERGKLYIGSGDKIARWVPAAGEPENGHWTTVATLAGVRVASLQVVNDRLLVVATGEATEPGVFAPPHASTVFYAPLTP